MLDRFRISTSLLWFVVALASVARAEPFDPRVKAPKVATAAELQALFKTHFGTFQQQSSEQPAALARDRSASQRWSDLYFMITHAMDAGMPLKNMAAFGLIAHADGTYTVDVKKFPQWAPLDSQLHIFSDAQVLEMYVPSLKARGFRDSDIAAVRNYVATSNPRESAFPRTRALVESFARRLQERKQSGLPLDLDEIASYRYQRTMISMDTERQWAVGLLDVLDSQRQRILASFFGELSATITFGKPTQPLARSLEAEAQPLMSAEHVRLIAAEEVEIASERQRRFEKLTGGL